MTEIVRMVFGSQLYGTSTPASDTDLKAVHIPSPEQILLGRTPRAINQVTKANEREKNAPEDTDFESFGLQHFMKLLCEGQTVCLDMLYAPDSMIINKTWEWEWIVDHRKEFVSRQCQSYIGYCRQQANKYGIKGSRVAAVRLVLDWLKEAAEDMGHLAKVGEVEWDWLDSQEHAEVLQITIASGAIIPHLNVCNRKVPFGSTLKIAIDVYQRLFDEYGKRALMAEKNEGVDWKALSHAVRIGRQAIDVLSGNDIIFPLPYADFITAIKKGEYDYSMIGEMIDDLLVQVEQAAETSPLPEQPNFVLAEQFVLGTYFKQIQKYECPFVT